MPELNGLLSSVSDPGDVHEEYLKKTEKLCLTLGSCFCVGEEVYMHVDVLPHEHITLMNLEMLR